jgi:hypothetical protein
VRAPDVRVMPIVGDVGLRKHVSSASLTAGSFSADDARDAAHAILGPLRPDLWRRTEAVAARAQDLAVAVGLPPQEQAVLLSVAWLHLVGATQANTSPHRWEPVDGARLLHIWGLDRFAGYVAWQGVAYEEAGLLGLRPILARYPQPQGLVADLLTVATMTVGTDGQVITMAERVEQLRREHGQSSVHAKALRSAWARLDAANARVLAATRR